MKRRIREGIFAVTLSLCFVTSVHAQHPIDIERAAAQGDYIGALTQFETMPVRIRTTSSIIAAAKSAWALSLPEKAQLNFEAALKDPKITAMQRAQLLLSRAVIEYQEGKHNVSILRAEKALAACEQECLFASRIHLLWGQSLASLNSHGAADEHFTLALETALPNEIADISFFRGMTRLHLGKNEDARADFEKVPLTHERTPDAIRSLALIALEANDFEGAAFWLSKGRNEFPENFLDSWVDYALLQVAVYERDEPKVALLTSEAQKKYPPSDPWLTIINATAETYFWEGRRP